MLATGFQTKFIPVLSAFGVILVADVLHYQVSLLGLMKVVSSWHILVLDTNFHLVSPSWFLPNSALTLFFVCWECLSICALLPSQLEQLLILITSTELLVQKIVWEIGFAKAKTFLRETNKNSSRAAHGTRPTFQFTYPFKHLQILELRTRRTFPTRFLSPSLFARLLSTTLCQYILSTFCKALI